MNERLVEGERGVTADDETAEVAKPSDAAFDNPALLVASQHAPAARRCRSPCRQSLVPASVADARHDAAAPRIIASVSSASRTSAGDAA
jgi:hypothetical protein